MRTLQELRSISTLPGEYSPPFVTAVAFSPDGQQLATSGRSSKVGGPHGYKGGLITIRDTKNGLETHRFDDLPHASDSIAFSPDGKLFAAGTLGAGGELPSPGELRIWNAKDGKLLHVWRQKATVDVGEDQGAMMGIAFSPDSRTIAIACSDGGVRLWDLATAKVRSEFQGHPGLVRRVAFSPDGLALASAGSDHTVRLWSLQSGQERTIYRVESTKIQALIFNPAGNLLVAGGVDLLRKGEVRMWRITDPDNR